MMHRNKKWVIVAVLLVVLQLLLQTRAAHIAQQNPTVTVTLSAPLTAGQLAAAREWEGSDVNTQSIAASFWSEKAASVSANSDRTTEDVTCIGFDGTAQDCLPVEYLQGTAPGVIGQQCAISSTLAWTLFGNYDIMGLIVTLDRTEYFISGVFKSERKMLLYPAQSGFTHAALRGLSPDTPKTDAEQWAAAAGAGKITAITYGPQKEWLAQAACALPALIVGLALVVLLLRFIYAMPGVFRGAALLALALAFAWAVPHFLQTLPGWLIPGRWSDFSFWPTLWTKIMDACNGNMQ